MLGTAVFLGLFGAITDRAWMVSSCAIPLIANIAVQVLGDKGSFHVLLTRLVARFTGGIAVEAMDYTNERYVTVAWPRDDGSWHGWLRWKSSTGYVSMLDIGMVDPTPGCGHIYIWRPLDRHREIDMMLRCDCWPDWDRWRSMSHMDKSAERRRLLERDD